MLKARTGRSFDALGRRAGVSGSSLHRYCAGSSVPSGFSALHAFALVCGATKEEIRELQRLWVLADANRVTAPVAVAAAGRPGLNGVALANGGPVAGGAAAHDRHAADEGAPPAATEAGGDTGPGAGNATPAADAAERDGGAVGPAARRRPVLLAAGVAVALIVVTATVFINWDRRKLSEAGAGPADERLLFSPACGPVVSMGQNDECVEEVQNLLEDAGTRLAIDGSFGPETLRRVTAFQVLAGLPPKGVVDAATKEALYEGNVSMATWSPDRVESRIREVFVEEPDRAVAIADCQSYLDPLWVTTNTNGSRNWGVFQISDARLEEFKTTPRNAFDPEWNISAAYELWKRRPDFVDWPFCSRAARVTAAPSKPAR